MSHHAMPTVLTYAQADRLFVAFSATHLMPSTCYFDAMGRPVEAGDPAAVSRLQHMATGDLVWVDCVTGYDGESIGIIYDCWEVGIVEPAQLYLKGYSAHRDRLRIAFPIIDPPLVLNSAKGEPYKQSVLEEYA